MRIFWSASRTLYLHILYWSFGLYHFCPLGFYFHSLQIFEKGFLCCFCSHAHNIHDMLNDLYLWTSCYSYSTKVCNQICSLFHAEEVVCSNIFKNANFYCGMKTFTNVVCHMVSSCCLVEKKASNDHATQLFFFWNGSALCHLIIFWMCLIGLCFCHGSHWCYGTPSLKCRFLCIAIVLFDSQLWCLLGAIFCLLFHVDTMGHW